jgi:imidazolonepropionase-like amidohydrolase
LSASAADEKGWLGVRAGGNHLPSPTISSVTMPRVSTAIHRQLAVAAAVLLLADPASAQSARPLLVRDVRVFDGTRMLEHRDVLVEGGRIATVSERRLTAPANAEVVEGSGRTLLPGLIDSHTHAFGDALRDAVMYGVTTELDMFTDAKFAATMRREQAEGRGLDRADLVSASVLVTAPKGHGTEYGMDIPTIAAPGEAQAFVDARIAEGSDYIKIVYDDGHTYGMRLPTVSKATMAAVVAAAHARGKLAVVHIGDLQGARDAIEVGADGLVHLFVDRDPDPELGRFVASHHAFVIPTLTVLRSITGVAGAGELAGDPRIEPYLSAASRGLITQSFPRRPSQPPVSYAAGEKTVRAMQAAGVPILAGTDAANPGTAHGAALHGELELLVKAGLSSAQALAAATSVPARAFKLADRGRIAPGLRADLVLVKGDPIADITATRDIERIWKRGAPVDRASFAAAIAEQKKNAGTVSPTLAAAIATGLVGDFESGGLGATFGTPWTESTDGYAGGKSTGSINVVDGGAEGSAKSLGITGMISSAVPYAWAGVMWSAGAQPMAPVDLSAKPGIAFWAKGDGKTYRIMIFAEAKGFTPLTQTFVAGSEWREVTVPWTAFGVDGKGVMAVIFAGGPEPGAFSFQIDNVRLR